MKSQIQTNVYCNLRSLDNNKIEILYVEAVTFVDIVYYFYWKEFLTEVGDWVW